MDDFWHLISEIADRASRDTGKKVSVDDVFNLARHGVIRVGAQIPALDGEDIGELQWHYPDGSQVGQYVANKIDGMAPWLDTNKLDTLVNRGQVTLSGVSWPISGGPTLTAGPDSRYIKRDNLRVPGPEYARILSALNGEAAAPREPEGTAPTPERHAAEPGAHLIQQWKELNECIVVLGQAKSNLQQSRQDWAILREELSQLEATPEFLSAVESHVAVLTMKYEPVAKGNQQDLIEHGAAEIEYWSAKLAKLRSERNQSIHPADRQAEAPDIGKPAPRQDGRVTLKRENQIRAIELAASELGYSDPLKIPTGGKAAIKEYCFAWTEFGHSNDGFKRAWTEANKQGRIRLAEKEKYM